MVPWLSEERIVVIKVTGTLWKQEPGTSGSGMQLPTWHQQSTLRTPLLEQSFLPSSPIYNICLVDSLFRKPKQPGSLS
jgi:hypothetical protein